MKLNLDSGAGKYQIKSYKDKLVTINQIVYRSSVIITPDLLLPWSARYVNELKQEDIAQWLKLCPEIVLFGTGDKINYPSQKTLAPLTNKQIGIEIMTTSAACRTYTILMCENRKVLAALII